MGAKTTTIILRCTPKEKEHIEERARAANMSTSKYLRRVALARRIVNTKDLAPLLYEVNQIGNNINQAVKMLNTFHTASDQDIAYIVEQWRDVRGRILNAISDMEQEGNDGNH